MEKPEIINWLTGWFLRWRFFNLHKDEWREIRTYIEALEAERDELKAENENLQEEIARCEGREAIRDVQEM